MLNLDPNHRNIRLLNIVPNCLHNPKKGKFLWYRHIHHMSWFDHALGDVVNVDMTGIDNEILKQV